MPDPVPLNRLGEPMAPGEADAYWNRRRLPKLAHIERTFVASGKLAEADWHQVLLHDHTPKGQHCLWLVTRIVRGALAADGLEPVAAHLALFLEHKRELPAEHRDLMRCRDPQALEALVAPFAGRAPRLSKKQRKRQERDQLAEDMPLVYEDGLCRIHWARTVVGARHLGRQTRWCTASERGSGFFRDYDATGDLLVVTPKRAVRHHEKYQYHWSYGAFHERDAGDASFAQRFPDAWAHLESRPLSSFGKVAKRYWGHRPIREDDVAGIVRRNGGAPLDDGQWLRLIRANDAFIDHREDPTAAMVAVACEANPDRLLRYEDMLPDARIAEIVAKRPVLLRTVRRSFLTEGNLAAVLDANPHALAHLDPAQVTERIALAAVRRQPRAVALLGPERQTPAVQLAVVAAEPQAVEDLAAPTAAAQRVAVGADPNAILRIADPDRALVEAYLERAGADLDAFERLPLAQRQLCADWALDRFARQLGTRAAAGLDGLPDRMAEGPGSEAAADRLEAALAEQVRINVRAAKRMGKVAGPYIAANGGLDDVYEVIDRLANGEVAEARAFAEGSPWIAMPAGPATAPEPAAGPGLAAG